MYLRFQCSTNHLVSNDESILVLDNDKIQRRQNSMHEPLEVFANSINTQKTSDKYY